MSTFGKATQSRSVIGKKLKTCSSRWIIPGTPQCAAVAMAASTTRAEKQQQGDCRQAVAASFDAMHGALASEAHAVARDFGVDVLTVEFCPDHAVGAGEETRARPSVESRSISPGAVRSKAAEDFEGRKKEKNLSSDYHVRIIYCV
jgi:hypothetical protein